MTDVPITTDLAGYVAFWGPHVTAVKYLLATIAALLGVVAVELLVLVCRRG